MRLIILASSIYSERAVAVVASLCESGRAPLACLSVSTINSKNVLRKIGQYGFRSFTSYALKRLNPFKTGSNYNKSQDYENEYIAARLKNMDKIFSNLAQACQHYSIPLVQSRNVHDPNALKFLKEYGPDLLIYTGGGILRKSLISIPKIGVLNAHGGILPEYRGMNVTEWALLYGDTDNIGITVHFIDTGIDTGDVIFCRHLKIPNNVMTIQSLRHYFADASVDALVDGVKYLDSEQSSFHPQTGKTGKQYFVMHQSLLELVEKRLNCITSLESDTLPEL